MYGGVNGSPRLKPGVSRAITGDLPAVGVRQAQLEERHVFDHRVVLPSFESTAAARTAWRVLIPGGRVGHYLASARIGACRGRSVREQNVLDGLVRLHDGCCGFTPLRSIGAPLMMLVNCKPQLL